jgi:hypothetical protein
LIPAIKVVEKSPLANMELKDCALALVVTGDATNSLNAVVKSVLLPLPLAPPECIMGTSSSNDVVLSFLLYGVAALFRVTHISFVILRAKIRLSDTHVSGSFPDSVDEVFRILCMPGLVGGGATGG